ncbi:alpha/beta hydrolase [Herbaspirillum sp. GCM10030257]|uniref:alpha/beta hydrolase n=1 Tax=Herbaspirillum sp. GCM10030257 TaxID=3273393 RepID=UPI00361CDF7D
MKGRAGDIEVIVDLPRLEPCGIALVGHSHPLLGGTWQDKVTHTIAKSLADCGYIVCRPAFRGTGRTDGQHDQGEGEAHDMVSVYQHALRSYGTLPVILAGFSFGAYVQSKAVVRLADIGRHPCHMLLVSIALGNVRATRFYDTPDLPIPTVLIHGMEDDRVPIQRVYEWAGRQHHPVIAMAGADHFFNGSLTKLREIIVTTANGFR